READRAAAMGSKRSPRAPAVVVVVVLLLFVLMPDEADAQVFCRSQFNLANEACSLRTYPGANPAVPPRRPLLLNASSSASGYELQAAGDEHSASGGHGGEHGSSHGADPYDTACCRRLMGIDNACICQAMSFLPQFMSRVKHSIKLTPVPGCDISFECAGVY
uniref:Bifunctional inhibitor/plant lipid transfer protein/seed storage helical domain-containing protein n=1 Tax=Aegilops tauschii subsp. strangulata TaxID=200361 RepID=A0A453KLK0_AEGTS